MGFLLLRARRGVIIACTQISSWISSMRRGIGCSSGVQAVLKVTPRKWGISSSAPAVQSLWCFWKCLSGDQIKPAHYLGNLEQPQSCLPSALLTLSKEKSHGRCTPNLAFCTAPCKGNHASPCRHLRTCRYLGVAQESELGED